MEFKRVRNTSRDIAQARAEAVPEATRAVREVETALQEALDGEPLRGLRNLGGSASFYAARVRAKADKKLPGPNERKGERDWLCLSPKGELIIAWWEDVEDDEVELRDRLATDDELRVDDVEALLKTLQWILPRHIDAAERAKARYTKAVALSTRINEIMEAA
jgi:hypothetical protein